MTEQYGQLPSDSDIWRFPAAVEYVVDGDTLDMTFDLGMRVQANGQRVRLYGVDTAEIYGVEDTSDEYREGIEHMQFVEDWLKQDESGDFPFKCYTLKGAGKYGRWLVDVVDSDGNSLVGALFDRYGSDVSYNE